MASHAVSRDFTGGRTYSRPACCRMAEDEIVVYYGETTKVIGKFEAGSRGLDVLEVVETMTTEKGSVVFCANGRAVTKGSQNLVAGSYRFDAAPGRA